MPTLRIDVGGASQMDLACQKAGHAAPRLVGARGLSASGAEHSQIRAEAMVVPVVLAPLPTATVATIRSLFALGARVSCAGDVFNNGGATLACSGTITDELHETADRWTTNLTLHDVGATLGYTPATTAFLLTSVDSPDSADPVTYLSTPAASYPGDAATSFNALAGVTVVGTTPVTSASPERAWLSERLNPALAYGVPTLRMESAMTGTYSGTTVWAQMNTVGKLSLVRAGAVVAGPWTSDQFGVDFGVNPWTVSFPVSVVLSLQANDRFLVELFSTLQLQPAQTDNGQRQQISYGNAPYPRLDPVLTIGGTLTAAP